jgi:hypothetical protein
VLIFAAVDAAVIPLVIRAVIVSTWGDLEKRFPGRPPAPDAVVREFQSLRIGSTNYGGCVHLGVDAGCPHLLPARFVRWFGAGPISVPWERIYGVRPARRGPMMTLSIGETALAAPRWAIEPAADGSASGPDRQ